MKPFSKFLLTAFVSAAMALPNIVQAMEIRQFDKMADQDQSEYIGNLIVGTENALIDEGKPDLAARIKTLFTTKNDPRDADVLGMLEFEMNLATARVVDAQRVAQDPNAHRLEVEDAMLATLKTNNIPMTRTFVQAFRAINKDFQPKSSPVVPPADAPPPQ